MYQRNWQYSTDLVPPSFLVNQYPDFSSFQQPFQQPFQTADRRRNYNPIPITQQDVEYTRQILQNLPAYTQFAAQTYLSPEQKKEKAKQYARNYRAKKRGLSSPLQISPQAQYIAQQALSYGGMRY